MRIESVSPPPPPREIRMAFPVGEGWAIVAALQEYVHKHPDAVYAERWMAWVRELDAELRR